MAEIAAIVLAAGSGSRFGSDKRLHPMEVNGVTLPMLAHSLRPWLVEFDEVSVVIRTKEAAMKAAIETAFGADAGRIRWVECPDAQDGMGRSLACGIGSRPLADGWMIGLGDMPGLPRTAIAAVRLALENGLPLAAAAHAGRRGHPVGFAATFLPELLALEGDSGARSLLQRHAPRLQLIETDSPAIFEDIDTREALPLPSC